MLLAVLLGMITSMSFECLHVWRGATFFGELADQVFESEAARTLHKRMTKYRSELFTFLDHDGIPWNNNNAEHAIKHFAKYRPGANDGPEKLSSVSQSL